MAHYAFINSNNIVVEVISGKDEDDTSTLPDGYSSWEEYYESKREGLTCKRTSINTVANTHREGGTPFRGNYAGIGMTWDADNDVFLPQKLFDSWVLNTDDWQYNAPIDYPNDGNNYIWNENAYQTDTADPKTQGWELVE